MSTLTHPSLRNAAAPRLRLLERRPDRVAAAERAATVEPPQPSLWQRVEAWVDTWPEPPTHHRLGSWTLRR